MSDDADHAIKRDRSRSHAAVRAKGKDRRQLCTCPERGDPDWNGCHEPECAWTKTPKGEALKTETPDADAARDRLTLASAETTHNLSRDRDIILVAIYDRLSKLP